MISEMIEWERRVLRELYNEYEYILRSRRIDLRPAAITLTDSEAFWAQWNPTIRTILISRKLIRNHNWFQVLSILKHEMAHQFIEESDIPNANSAAPHGALFAFACQKLGVPEEYTGATVCLQTTPLDWRQEKRDEVSEKMLEKVRKLLSLATSSNEHEALLAMNKVREIYAKYNLEQVSTKSTFAHLTITHEKKRIEAHQSRIMSILVEHFFVQVITTRLFNPQTGDYHAGFELVGTRENVMMAEYVYHFLLGQTHALVLEMAKKYRLSRIQRKSYRLGILSGFSEKLLETEKQNAQSQVKSEGAALISKALAQFQKDPALDNYLAQVYPRLSKRGTNAQYIDGSIFTAGKSAGRKISLNKAMTGASGNAGRLLTGG